MDMKTCETCGNYYERAIVVQLPDGGRHVFDCFECAIHKLAPSCEHCQCRIIGHGVEHDGQLFCCESCARMAKTTLHGESAADERLVTTGSVQSFPASDPPAY